MARSLPHQLHSAAHLELRQQRRDVEFYGALGEIQICSDFLVGETLHQAGKYFFLPARQPDLTVDGFPGLQELSRLFIQAFQNLIFGLDQDDIIARRLASHDAVHRQQPRRLVYRKSPVWAGLHVKMGRPGILFIKEEDVARKRGTGIWHLLRMVTSADRLHVHPLRMQPRDGTEAYQILIFAPRRGPFPTLGKQSGKRPMDRLAARRRLPIERQWLGAGGNSLKVRLRALYRTWLS